MKLDGIERSEEIKSADPFFSPAKNFFEKIPEIPENKCVARFLREFWKKKFQKTERSFRIISRNILVNVIMVI